MTERVQDILHQMSLTSLNVTRYGSTLENYYNNAPDAEDIRSAPQVLEALKPYADDGCVKRVIALLESIIGK